MAIQDFNLKPEYLPGKQNAVADYLSRAINGRFVEGKSEEILIAFLDLKYPNKNLVREFKRLRECQSEDDFCVFVNKNLAKGVENAKNKYRIVNGYLCKSNAFRDKIILPNALVKDFVREVHYAYGHVGPNKVFKLITEQFFAPKLRKLVHEYLRACDDCQRNKHLTIKYHDLMQPILVNMPNELLSIDFYGPLPTSTGGVKYLLTTIDVFSKFVVIYAIKKANTASVINKIFSDYVVKYGKPSRIIIDHGTQFSTEKWINRLKYEKIQPVFSSVRHPQSNSVERIHRELGRFFRTLVRDKHASWARHVKDIQEIMNEVHHDSTNYTPIELHLGLKPKRLWEKWLDIPTTAHELPIDRKIYLARESMHKRLKNKADKKNKVNKHFKFDIGDLVLVKAQNVSNAVENKIAKFFSVYEGPYRIVKKISSDTYLLFDEKCCKERGTFHVKLLKYYYAEAS